MMMYVPRVLLHHRTVMIPMLTNYHKEKLMEESDCHTYQMIGSEPEITKDLLSKEDLEDLIALNMFHNIVIV